MQERKWVASGLIVVGLALIFGLESITGLSTDVSAFDRVERRIPGGAVMGFGLALLNLRSWTHKVAFVASAFAWLTVGALTGRILGIMTVGGDVGHQWFWVAAEVVVIGVGLLTAQRATP